MMTNIIETNKLLRDLNLKTQNINETLKEGLEKIFKQNEKIIELLDYIQAQTQ